MIGSTFKITWISYVEDPWIMDQIAWTIQRKIHQQKLIGQKLIGQKLLSSFFFLPSLSVFS
jgi:hypothetical protein